MSWAASEEQYRTLLYGGVGLAQGGPGSGTPHATCSATVDMTGGGIDGLYYNTADLLWETASEWLLAYEGGIHFSDPSGGSDPDWTIGGLLRTWVQFSASVEGHGAFQVSDGTRSWINSSQHDAQTFCKLGGFAFPNGDGAIQTQHTNLMEYGSQLVWGGTDAFVIDWDPAGTFTSASVFWDLWVEEIDILAFDTFGATAGTPQSSALHFERSGGV